MLVPLQIAIVHQNANTRSILQGMVLQMGHAVCLQAGSRQNLLDQARTVRPDLIIIQESLPDGSGTAAVSEVYGEEAIPVIFVLGPQVGQPLQSACDARIFAVLPEPVRSSDLAPLIPLVMQQFTQQRQLREKIAQLESQMSEEP